MNKPMKSEPKNEIVVYQPNESLRLEVAVSDETVWLSQEQMITLFERDRSVISRHIRNAFDEGEVDEKTCLHFLQTNLKGRPEAFYNLDVVISVGYRVKSIRGTMFRRWATSVLREYLLRGYAFNARMNQLEDKVDRRMLKTEQDVLDLKEKVDYFVQTQIPPIQGVFYEGQVFDARVFATKHILSAKKSIPPKSRT